MNPRIFFDRLQKSGLLPSATIKRALLDCRKANGDRPLGDLDLVCEVLVENGYLTSWQANKLRQGKHRGFFLGKYKLLGHIGTGGMSSVYLAEHTLMKQQRAIKVLPRSRVDDQAYLDRFYLEARASAALRHPNIVQSIDIDCEDQNHYIVMEYVDGKDLNITVKEEGPPSIELAANYVAQAALGLASAHESGVIHRDIKPGNLLVDKEGVVKILDMGLALYSNDTEEPQVDREEKMLGTADYLAPEQSRDSRKVDERADIYALGCTLYFLIAGHAPFPKGTIAERITNHRHRMPPPLRELREECPKDLEEICWKMIQKNPDARYQTANEVLAALNGWLVSVGCEAVEVDKKSRTSPLRSHVAANGGAIPADPASSSDSLISGLVTKPVRKNDGGDDSKKDPNAPKKGDSPTVSVKEDGVETHPSRLPGAESSIAVAKPSEPGFASSKSSQLEFNSSLFEHQDVEDDEPEQPVAEVDRFDDKVMDELAAIEQRVYSPTTNSPNQTAVQRGVGQSSERSHFLLRLPAWVVAISVVAISILGLLLIGLLFRLMQ